MQKRIYAIKENALKQYKIIPEHAKKHKLTFIFFHLDYTVGFGITQIMPFGSWAVPPVGNYTLP